MAVPFTGLRRTARSGAGRDALIAVAAAWPPLFLLAAWQGSLFGPPTAAPFLLDVAAHVRFLLAVPLLLLDGPVIDQRLAPVVAQIRASLVGEPDRPRFDAVLGHIVRWRNLQLIDLVLFALAVLDSIMTARRVGIGWQLGPNGGLSPAGWWFVLVSQPLFEFLLFRWLWRLFLWTLFLVRLSRLPLQLVATHPDRAGGLAFVGEAQLIFATLVLPVSAIGAASYARRIAYEGLGLAAMQRPLLLFVLVVLLLVLGPLLSFTPKLVALKRRGMIDYGRFAHEYTREFERKWLNGARGEEDPLGSQDIQALADLGTSFNVVREMSIVPVPGRRALLGLLLAAVAPMIVPAAVAMSVPEVVRRLLGAFLGRGAG